MSKFKLRCICIIAIAAIVSTLSSAAFTASINLNFGATVDDSNVNTPDRQLAVFTVPITSGFKTEFESEMSNLFADQGVGNRS